MRVLVAEDHQSLARSIADGLREEGGKDTPWT